MGRYEDLIEEARAGNTEALDALEQEFSGTALREKAEQADSYQEKYQQALPHLRRARFEDLVGRLDEDLRGVVSVDDFGEFDPDALTLEEVQDRARQRHESRQAQKQAAAQEAGFDTVEEYEEALQTVKRSKQETVEGMETVAGGVASSGGEPAGTDERSRYEKGREAFEGAKQEGRADDWAMAQGIEALLEDQAEEAEKS